LAVKKKKKDCDKSQICCFYRCFIVCLFVLFDIVFVDVILVFVVFLIAKDAKGGDQLARKQSEK
jgi:hypothetical protein